MKQFLAFIFLCLVWGTTWIAIKITLEGFPPLLGAALRFTFALSVLFLFARARKITLRLNRKSFGILFLSAFLMYAFDYGLIYWGEQYLSAGVTAIFFATFPLFTGLWATFLFKNEQFVWNKFLGLILGFFGIVVVFYDQLLIADYDLNIVAATLAVVLGAAGGAMAIVLVKKYLSEINSISLTLNQMLYGVLSLYILVFIFELPAEIHLTARVVFSVLYLGGVGSALAFGLYYWLLKHQTATTLSLIIYITPIVALFIDYLVFGEVIQRNGIIGTLIIFAGIALNQLSKSTARLILMRFKR